MKVLVAPDSFKGSLKSPDVARAMARGARRACPTAEILELPVGDGGEGTLDALVAATRGRFEVVKVTGPLGDPVQARLGLLGDEVTCFVEMAEASGLSLVPEQLRNPLHASTFGTGELIRAAAATRRKRLLIGIGGSATNDAGAGTLQALGARLLDDCDKELPPGGIALVRLRRIDLEHFAPPGKVEIIVACDVTNPLTGSEGAAAIYGPQKGVTPDQIPVLDAALEHFATVAGRTLGVDLADHPGAGAAGGLGYALMAFLGARLERGVQLVLDAIDFEKALEGTTLILTGEGRIDRQTTSFGKTLSGIGDRARHAGIPVLALAGSLSDDLGDYRSAGISGVASVVPRPMSLEEAMRCAPALVEDAARRVVEVFLSGNIR